MRKTSDGMMNKHIFVWSLNAFSEIQHEYFLDLVCALGIFFLGFDFSPVRSSPSLEIWSAPSTPPGWEYLFRSFHLWSQLCKRKRSSSRYTPCSTFRYSGRADWRKDSVKRNAASMNFYVNQLTPGYDELLSRHLRRIEITIIPTIITSSSASSSMWSLIFVVKIISH